jgi:hypothetical protein
MRRVHLVKELRAKFQILGRLDENCMEAKIVMLRHAPKCCSYCQVESETITVSSSRICALETPLVIIDGLASPRRVTKNGETEWWDHHAVTTNGARSAP